MDENEQQQKQLEEKKASTENKIVKKNNPQDIKSIAEKKGANLKTKSSQAKASGAASRSSTVRPSSGTGVKKTRPVVSSAEGIAKRKDAEDNSKQDVNKKQIQKDKRPISGVSRPAAKSSTLQNKNATNKEVNGAPTKQARTPTPKLAQTNQSAPRNRPTATSQSKPITVSKTTGVRRQVAGTVKGTERNSQIKPKVNGVKKSVTKNSVSNSKPGTKSPDAQFAKMSLEISNSPLAQLPSYNRQTSQGDQLITFKDTLNPKTDFDQLSRLLEGSLDEKEKQCLTDLKEYLVKKEDAWILDQKLLNFIGGLLEHRSLNADIRVKLLRLLAAGALRVDFWSFLQMDRKERHLMKYPNDFEDLSVEEQKAVALFLCNNFSSGKGAEWLMYGSPWKIDEKRETSNVRITSKVAAYSLVSYTPSLQDYGSALIYNIALKEAKALSVPLAKYTEEGLPTVQLDYGSVSDKDIMTNSTNGLSETKFVTLKVYNDVTVELCMAILKFIKKTKNPNEEILYRCVKSLLKFSLILKGELLSCIAMVQTDLDDQIPGKSDRIDKVWAQLRQQLLSNSEPQF